MTLPASQNAADRGTCCTLFAWSIFCHAVSRVGTVTVGVGGRQIHFVGGMYSSSFSVSSLLVAFSVVTVLLSSHSSLTLLAHTVLSLADSGHDADVCHCATSYPQL